MNTWNKAILLNLPGRAPSSAAHFATSILPRTSGRIHQPRTDPAETAEQDLGFVASANPSKLRPGSSTGVVPCCPSFIDGVHRWVHISCQCSAARLSLGYHRRGAISLPSIVAITASSAQPFQSAIGAYAESRALRATGIGGLPSRLNVCGRRYHRRQLPDLAHHLPPPARLQSAHTASPSLLQRGRRQVAAVTILALVTLPLGGSSTLSGLLPSTDDVVSGFFLAAGLAAQRRSAAAPRATPSSGQLRLGVKAAWSG